jgi:hypothetical protein
MHKRSVRYAILLVLLALGIGAAVELAGIQRRIEALDADGREVSRRIDRISSAITFIAAAQHTYLGSEQPDELSLNRVSVLVEQVANETTVLRTRIRAANSPSHLQGFADALAGLINADARAREILADGQSLAAADIVFREARDDVADMEAKLRELQYAETAAFDAQQLPLGTRTWSLIGGVAVLWALGLIALVRVPAPPEAMSPPQLGSVLDIQPPPVSVSPHPSSQVPDLEAAAGLCNDISRLTSIEALPAILGRAAEVLEASGLIIWMGAGEELFAVASHGYDAQTVSRLGSIGLNAENATAAAWRTGQVRVVPRDETSAGAIVLPIFITDGCAGVVGIELRNGKEADPATRAVASIITAQLATVLPAWPSASATPDRGSERHAAAS